MVVAVVMVVGVVDAVDVAVVVRVVDAVVVVVGVVLVAQFLRLPAANASRAAPRCAAVASQSACAREVKKRDSAHPMPGNPGPACSS